METFDPDKYIADNGIQIESESTGFDPDAYIQAKGIQVDEQKSGIVPAAVSNLKGVLSTTANVMRGQPQAIADTSVSANEGIKPFYRPIPMIENAKERVKSAIPGDNIASDTARGLVDLIPASPLDLGLTTLGTGALNKGVNAIASVPERLLGTAEQRSKSLVKKATDAYRFILRPNQGEVRNIEIRSGKNINDYYQLAAEERLPINQVKGKDGRNVLDTKEARDILVEKQSAVHEELNNKLLNSDARFDLEDLRKMSKIELKRKYENASEYESAVSDVNDYIDAEIRKFGSIEISAIDMNNVKRGMWQVGYKSMRPTASKTARTIGHVAKESIEQEIDDPAIKTLNNESGRYETLTNLLKNAHDRVVPGGKLGGYFARATGAIVGHSTNIPVVGPLIGEKVGGKIAEAMSNPETISRIASKNMGKAEKLLESIGKKVSDLKIGDVIKTPNGNIRVTGFNNSGAPLVSGNEWKSENAIKTRGGNTGSNSTSKPLPKTSSNSKKQTIDEFLEQMEKKDQIMGERKKIVPYAERRAAEEVEINKIFKPSEITGELPNLKVGQTYNTAFGKIRITKIDASGNPYYTEIYSGK